MRKKLFESDYDYTLADYIENLKDNDDFDENKEYTEDEDFYDWKSRMRECDIDDLWANLSFPNHKGAFIITGTLGLWNGRPEIRPIVCDDLKRAIQRCVCNRDIYEFEVYYDDGCYEVLAHHHDGTNCFNLYELTESGERIARNKYENSRDFQLVKNWIKRIPVKNYYLF